MTKQELFDLIKGTIVVSCQATPGEPLQDRQHQPQIAADQLFSGYTVPCMGAAQQRRHLVIFQHRQLRRVDAAYLHPAPHNATCLLLDRGSISRRGGGYSLRRKALVFARMGHAPPRIG